MFDREGRRGGAGILEVFIKNEDVGPEGRADLRLRDQLAISRHRAENAGECTAAEKALTAAAVGRPGRRQSKAGDAGVIKTGRSADDGLALAERIPGNAQARLPHVVVRRDFAVRREFLAEAGLADEVRKEDLVGRGDHVGLDLRFPAQAHLHGETAIRLPGILEKKRRLFLGDGLGAGFFDRQIADASLLQVEQHRAGDFRAGRADAGL